MISKILYLTYDLQKSQFIDSRINSFEKATREKILELFVPPKTRERGPASAFPRSMALSNNHKGTSGSGVNQIREQLLKYSFPELSDRPRTWAGSRTAKACLREQKPF